MSKNIFLSKPGLISTLGNGIEKTVQSLLSPHEHFLTPSDKLVTNKTLYFGSIKQQLPNFEPETPEIYRNKTNQLLYQAAKQIEPEIINAIQQYGPENVAVIIGTTTTGIDKNIPAFQAYLNDTAWDSSGLELKSLEMSLPAEFISWRYQTKGFCYGISTACTSGIKALMSAARMLRTGLCKAVICGGVDVLSPLTINGFNSLEVLSSTISNPFSKNRDGINIGEAAAIFVMTTNANEGLPILGYAANNDAWHMSSPRPDAIGATQCIAQTLTNATLNSNDVTWINLHGTGTLLNDAMESKAIAEIFNTKTLCTSTKPYTGHTLGAAGALETAIIWGVLHKEYNPHGKLPPHRWDGCIDEKLPHINLTGAADSFPVSTPRIAMNLSFAFGGNNAAIILGE